MPRCHRFSTINGEILLTMDSYRMKTTMVVADFPKVIGIATGGKNFATRTTAMRWWPIFYWHPESPPIWRKVVAIELFATRYEPF